MVGRDAHLRAIHQEKIKAVAGVLIDQAVAAAKVRGVYDPHDNLSKVRADATAIEMAEAHLRKTENE